MGAIEEDSMSFVQTTLSAISDTETPWRNDWLWGLPLILTTVIIHTWGLTTMCRRTIRICRQREQQSPSIAASSVAVGVVTLWATILHATEAAIWAAAFRAIGALQDAKSAMLYSLGALTTYGHQTVYLEEHWRLLGTIEALNGWLLFGLSTAFLFWLIQEVSPGLQSSAPQPQLVVYNTDSSPLPHP
jgi:hypothetical protein